MSSRACFRCIAKKRRCDHRQPTCESCAKANEQCAYPPPRARRGPMQGLTKILEERIDEYERALWFLLGHQEVIDILHDQAAKRGLNAELDACPMSRYDRDDRRDMWKENGMKNLGDLIGFRRRMAREGMDELPDDNPPDVSDCGSTCNDRLSPRMVSQPPVELHGTASSDVPVFAVADRLTNHAASLISPVTTTLLSQIAPRIDGPAFSAVPPVPANVHRPNTDMSDLLASWASSPPVAHVLPHARKKMKLQEKRRNTGDDVFW